MSSRAAGWIAAGFVVSVLFLSAGLLASGPASQTKTPPVSFDTQIRPVLEKRCQPCHFTGGKMYAKLPFDRPQTIRSLGEKMFTRIRDPKEQALLQAFLAQEGQPEKGTSR